MTRYYIGLFLTALTTLMIELNLTRVFDVMVGTSLAYMIISSAVFAFGLSGIYSTIFPLPDSGARGLDKYLAQLALYLAISLIVVVLLVNLLPARFLDMHQLAAAPWKVIATFGGLYIGIIGPFFFAGLIAATLISIYPQNITALYFWDLLGAALGCLVILPFLPVIGPGGIVYLGIALALLAMALFTSSRISRVAALALALVALAATFPRIGDYLGPFSPSPGRFAQTPLRAAHVPPIEVTRWDLISKIDVVTEKDQLTGALTKGILYDGHRQHSIYVPFDGDFERLRDDKALLRKTNLLETLAPHYLKRDTNQRVLNIGSAGGNEIRAALLYGASHVDAIDLVSTVIELGKTKYADYTGNIFNHPQVDVLASEGRSFLRSTSEKYDVIQIISNHTTSSVASGSGAMSTDYLFTVEAFKEYIEHLTSEGILHTEMLVHPRLITTAAAAWSELGRRDFQKHVVVIENGDNDWQPSLLIKNSTWTTDEVEALTTFFDSFSKGGQPPGFQLTENPLRPEESFLSPEFYSGELSDALLEKVRYRITPARDDRPFLTLIREDLGTVVSPDSDKYMTGPISDMLNRQLLNSFPNHPILNSLFSGDYFHLVVIGGFSLSYAVIFTILPLYFSTAGKATWPGKMSVLLYFSCLGAGFIIIELTLIQIFMHFIGYPLYVYSTVLFAMLLGAGVGSLSSRRLGISEERRWGLAFAAILLLGAAFLAGEEYLFAGFMGYSVGVRVAVAFVIVAPFGFFLGIPFPLGIMALERYARPAIPWGWAMNGLFTIVGGLASVAISVSFGFRAALIAALGIYILAFYLFARIRTAAHIVAS